MDIGCGGRIRMNGIVPGFTVFINPYRVDLPRTSIYLVHRHICKSLFLFYPDVPASSYFRLYVDPIVRTLDPLQPPHIENVSIN